MCGSLAILGKLLRVNRRPRPIADVGLLVNFRGLMGNQLSLTMVLRWRALRAVVRRAIIRKLGASAR